jgi:hypothetical protein
MALAMTHCACNVPGVFAGVSILSHKSKIDHHKANKAANKTLPPARKETKRYFLSFSFFFSEKLRT